MKYKRSVMIALAASMALAQAASAVPIKRTARTNAAKDYTALAATNEMVYQNFLADAERRMTSYSYGDVLQFARCVMRFDPAAAAKAMEVPIGSDTEETRFTRMAEANRSCLQGPARIHPLLIRAALAEAAMDQPPASQELRNPIGVPAVAKGRPLRTTSQCQVEASPELVEAVFDSRPGSADEVAAVANLFAKAPQCGTWDLEKTSSTVTRLSLIEARYRLLH